MSPIVEFFVLFAAMLYIGSKLTEMISGSVKVRVSGLLRNLSELHERAYSDIEGHFDMWWLSGPSLTVRNNAMRLSPIPDESVPDELKSIFTEQVLQQCKADAFHLAAHANMGDRERIIFAKLPRIASGIRSEIELERRLHEHELESARRQLIEVGIDVDDLERIFAA